MQVFDDRFQAESGWNCVLFCYKTLHVSGNLFAHHQEFSNVHSALVSLVQVSMTVSKQSQDGTQFHPDSAWKRSSKTSMKLNSAECTVENS
jgi:L-lactate permease